jgi:hypothetical protein
VDPVPDPLLLWKFGSAGNRTRDLWKCGQKLWPLDHRRSSIRFIQTTNKNIGSKVTTFCSMCHYYTHCWSSLCITACYRDLTFLSLYVALFATDTYGNCVEEGTTMVTALAASITGTLAVKIALRYFNFMQMLIVWGYNVICPYLEYSSAQFSRKFPEPPNCNVRWLSLLCQRTLSVPLANRLTPQNQACHYYTWYLRIGCDLGSSANIIIIN